jgi:inorganic pyrophosphatase
LLTRVGFFNTRYARAVVEAEANIGKTFEVIIDRPIGTEHPKHKGLYYPINYGEIESIIGGNGECQDVYIVDAGKPLKKAKVKSIAVIFRENDDETKWVGIIGDKIPTQDEVRSAIQFQEKYYDIRIIITSDKKGKHHGIH